MEWVKLAATGGTPGGGIIDFDPTEIDTLDINLTELIDSINLQIWRQVGGLQWRDFVEARDYVKSLNLKGQVDWNRWAKSSERPPDIPTAPWTAYEGKGWVSLGDWLGTGRLSNQARSKNFRDFYPAREYVWTLKLEDANAWLDLVASGKLPDDIPSSPEAIYPNEWKGFNDWLGNGRRSYLRQWRPFQAARTWARSLGLKSGTYWNALSKATGLPEDIPQDPRAVYKGEFVSMPDWLGSATRHWSSVVWRPFAEAREFIRGLGLSSGALWKEYIQAGHLPSDIPRYPNEVYREEWISLQDWLGAERWSYSKAREYVRPLGITSSKRWDRYASAGNLPANIPRHPKEFYQSRGWVDWADFLGYYLEKNVQPKWKLFSEARIWARSLGLKNYKQWGTFNKSAEFPSDVPKAPDQAYKEHGWNGWPDFLGYTAKQARHRRD